jgi:hypothetical protein
MYKLKSKSGILLASCLFILVMLGGINVLHQQNMQFNQHSLQNSQTSPQITMISQQITGVVYFKGNAQIVLNSSIEFNYTIIISSKSSTGIQNVVQAPTINGDITAGLNTISIEFNLGTEANPGVIELSIFIVSIQLSQPLVITMKFISVGYYPLIVIPTFLIISVLMVSVKEETLLEPKPKQKKKKEVKFDDKKTVTPQQSTAPKYAFPQIECPECKKSIDKGSAYCEHCGFHLPVYQRNG